MAFEDSHECLVEIKNGKRRILGFIIQLCDCLLQQEVVETDKLVFGSITLLERGRKGAAGKTPKRLEGGDNHFVHSHAMNAFHVRN